jgi:hypothetical protein
MRYYYGVLGCVVCLIYFVVIPEYQREQGCSDTWGKKVNKRIEIMKCKKYGGYQ